MTVRGQRERAVNEYSKAKQTNDDTGGAQGTAEVVLKKAYSEGGTSVPAPTPARPAKSPLLLNNKNSFARSAGL